MKSNALLLFLTPCFKLFFLLSQYKQNTEDEELPTTISIFKILTYDDCCCDDDDGGDGGGVLNDAGLSQ